MKVILGLFGDTIMSSFIGNLNTVRYESLSSSNNVNGKLYVPVNKSALLYSHFEHVSGVAAKSNQNGVSISKLRILNSLIDRVSAINNEKSPVIEQIDSVKTEKMIAVYQKQMQAAMKNTYALSGARPVPGELFSFQI